LYRISTSNGELLSPVKDQTRFSVGDRVLVAVRPEHLRLASAAGRNGVNVLPGRVVRQKFTGKIVQFEVRLDERTNFIVDGTADRMFEANATVQVAWDVDVTNLYHYEEDQEIGAGVDNAENQAMESRGTAQIPSLSSSFALP